MTKAPLNVDLGFAWWWRWLYWPLTRFGLWLGLRPDPETIARDAMRAIRTRPTKRRAG